VTKFIRKSPTESDGSVMVF